MVARIIDVQLGMVVQMRYPKTILSSLVRASRRQRFGDPAHASPHARQGVGLAILKQLNTIAESSKEREEEAKGEKYFLVSYSRDPQSLL
jgi:hypothetical protein